MIRLYELRTEKGLSQREMAKAMQISQATYNNWENSKTQPSIEQLIKLADFFGVSVDDLIGHTDDGLKIGISREHTLVGAILSLEEESQAIIKQLIEKLQKK